MKRTFITPDGPFSVQDLCASQATESKLLIDEAKRVARATNYFVQDVIVVDSLAPDERESCSSASLLMFGTRVTRIVYDFKKSQFIPKRMS